MSKTQLMRVVYLLLHLLLLVFGLFCMRSTSSSWLNFGASLCAAGISGLVVFGYIILTDRVAEQLESLQELQKAGMLHVYPARSILIQERYKERLSEVHEHIDIIGFGLKALREDFGPDFPTWATKARVRILILDPAYPDNTQYNVADARDREENNVVGTIKNDVAAFIRDTKKVAASSDGRFKVRLYKTLPSVNYFRIDDQAFWGPYLINQQSRSTPTLLVKKPGLLFDRLSQHFEDIWTNDSLSSDAPF